MLDEQTARAVYLVFAIGSTAVMVAFVAFYVLAYKRTDDECVPAAAAASGRAEEGRGDRREAGGGGGGGESYDGYDYLTDERCRYDRAASLSSCSWADADTSSDLEDDDDREEEDDDDRDACCSRSDGCPYGHRGSAGVSFARRLPPS